METNFILIIFLCVISYAVTFLIAPLNIKVSRLFSIMSHPCERSIHNTKMPVAGGLSFAVPVIIYILYMALFHSGHYSDYFSTTVFLFCGLATILLGLIDDVHKLGAFKKLSGQVIICVFMYFFGFRISLFTSPWNDVLELGVFSFPATIFWYLLIINAFNLIDGLDGLSAGIAVIVSFVMAAVAYKYGSNFVVYTSLVLGFANLAFLRYNFHPAKIFMGDTGSMFNGFIIASICIAGNNQFKGVAATTLLVPIIVMFIPLAEISVSVIRRIKNKKNIFRADKGHYHHRLLKLGFSQKFIVLSSYFVTSLFGLIALGFTYTSRNLFFAIFLILSFTTFSVFYYVIKKEL